MAVSKQDRTYARTATDLERKYNFGKSFGEVYGLIDEAKRIAKEAEDAVNTLDTELDQEEVFNRLTNNGQAQGIYRTEDGDIYINGKYVEFDGAIIGGWDITDGALKKDVTLPDGTITRVFIQPTHKDYPNNTWIISCQRSTDGGKKFNGTFVLYSDGSAKFGNTMISADGTISINGGTVKINSDGTAQFGDTKLLADGIMEVGNNLYINPDGTIYISDDAGITRMYFSMNALRIFSESGTTSASFSHVNGESMIIADKIYARSGASGTFTTADGKTVTVTDGIVRSIS